MFVFLYIDIGLSGKSTADLTNSFELDCVAHSFFLEQSLAEMVSDDTLASYRKYKFWCHFLSKTYSQ